MKLACSLAAITVALAIATPARADDAVYCTESHLFRCGSLRSPPGGYQLGQRLGDWARRSDALVANPAAYDPARPASQCFQIIDDARKAGFAGTQVIGAYAFQSHPKARPVDGRMDYAITLDDARDYCVAYQRHAAMAAEWSAFADAAQGLINYATSDDQFLPDGEIEDAHARADACRAAWDRAHHAGASDDLRTTIDAAPTFGAVRAGVCDALDKAVDALVAAITADAAARRKKYTSVGIGGAKLELMIEYDGNSWRLPGGGETDDPRRLAKARVLYTWLSRTGDSDLYEVQTIRKYRFRGNVVLGMSEVVVVRPSGSVPSDLFK